MTTIPDDTAKTVTPKKGDLVRITHEGVVTATAYGSAPQFSMGNRWFDLSTVESVEILAPAEPPVGSIVVTKNNGILHGWKHGANGLWGGAYTWAEVLNGRTVVAIHTPGGAE